MSDKKLSVAFIGTGIMGAPIAGHILDAGYPVTVYNRTKAKTDDLVSRGAVWADSPAAAAKDADVVFTMVGYPADVEEIYLSGDGLLAAAKPGAYLIDLTTSAPELARDIAEAAEAYGKHAFDCPVTGGDTGAIAGTLTLIVGATDEGIEPVRAILETFSSKIYCFGGPGKGQAAKLANQVALSSCMVGMADALSFAQQMDLDARDDSGRHGSLWCYGAACTQIARWRLEARLYGDAFPQGLAPGARHRRGEGACPSRCRYRIHPV